MPARAGLREPFVQHLAELRSRALASLAFFVMGSVAGYLLHEQILEFLVKPLGQPVFYTSPAGGFEFVIKASLFFGFVVTIPLCIYQLLRFVEPALGKSIPSSTLIRILLASCALLITGMAFAYFVSLPAALYFLGSFASDNIKALISTSEYFSFITRYTVGFGLLFQLPLIMWVINSVKRISTKSLMKYQKWVIAASFVVAAILTPTPDIFNQLLMAIPPIVLYQATIVLLLIINRRSPS